MLRLRIISVFLSLVMGIQILPIAQIGYALSNNIWTEELSCTSEDITDKADPSIKNFLPTQAHHFCIDIDGVAANIYIHNSEQIPSNHSNDVVSPPPDILS